MQRAGFDGKASLIKLDEIDISYIEEYGFLRERYPYSLGKTYEYYCKESGKKVDLALKEKIENVGWHVFRQVPELVDGVYLVLKTLCKKYFLI